MQILDFRLVKRSGDTIISLERSEFGIVIKCTMVKNGISKKVALKLFRVKNTPHPMYEFYTQKYAWERLGKFVPEPIFFGNLADQKDNLSTFISQFNIGEFEKHILFEIFKQHEIYVFIMEWVGDVTFYDTCFENRNFIESPRCTTIKKKICKQLNELKSYGITHNDLHVGNIVLSDIDTNNPKVWFIDWGMGMVWSSAFLTEEEYLSREGRNTQFVYNKFCKQKSVKKIPRKSIPKRIHIEEIE